MILTNRHKLLRPALRLLIGAIFSLLLPQASSWAEESVTMNMRDADVRSVIQWMAETTGRHFIVDPEVQGTMTILSQEPLESDQAFQVFLHALELSGHTAIVNETSVTVIPASKSMSANTAVLDSFNGRSNSEKAVHVFKTSVVDAATLSKQLKPLVGEFGTISSVAGSNSVLLADSVENIKRIKALAQRIDQSGAIDIDVVRLQHTSAEESLRSLQQLQGLPSQGTPRLGLASDVRSNSILISGPAEQRLSTIKVLQQLDKPKEQRGTTEVVRVNFLNASDLVAVLAGFKDTQPDAAHVSIQASDAANALVLTAPGPILDEMKAVVAQIDVQREQVLLEAVIVEVSDQLIDSLGVEWKTQFNGSGTEAATDFAIEQTRPILDAAGNVTGQNSVLGPGLTLGHYRNGDLRALLTALSRSNEANLLSTPSIVALDNEAAEILVGSNVPILSGQTTSAAAGTDAPFSTIERKDIGVSLKVTPQINALGSITLDVQQEVENISAIDFAEDLVFDKRSIKTKVLVEDNEVLVLGGLTREDTRSTVDRVPVLGYIPILGKLFQRSSDEKVRNNLMVFIHPRILTNETVRKSETDRYRKSSGLDKKAADE